MASDAASICFDAFALAYRIEVRPSFGQLKELADLSDRAACQLGTENGLSGLLKSFHTRFQATTPSDWTALSQELRDGIQAHAHSPGIFDGPRGGLFG